MFHRFPALGFRNYRIFWIGQFISLIGSWMQSTTLPYLAYRLTDQPIYLGAVTFAASLPALLFLLPGGVLIERINKRKAVIAMQTVLMLQAFGLAFFTLSGQVTIWHILILTFISGSANAFEITARQAMLTELVSREALPNAIALNSTIFNAARVLGPSLTAPFLLFLGNQGEGWAFFANGISYLFVIAGLLMIQTQGDNHHSKVQSAGGLSQFMAGQRYIRETKIVAVLIMVVSIPAFLGFPFMQMLPVFARDVLHIAGEAETAAATRQSLLVTFQGIGALIAALSLAMFSDFRKKGLLLIAGEFVFALGLIGLALARRIGIAMPLMVMIGWGVVTQLALTNTLIQLFTKDEYRGRVLSTYLWAQQGITPFGALLIGWMIEKLSAPVAVAICGGIVLAGYAVFHILRPEIRRATG